MKNVLKAFFVFLKSSKTLCCLIELQFCVIYELLCSSGIPLELIKLFNVTY